MESDDLNRPLGLRKAGLGKEGLGKADLGKTPRPTLPARILSARSIAMTIGIIALTGGIGFLYWRGDPHGGEPNAIAMIEAATPPQPAASVAAPAGPASPDKTTGSVRHPGESDHGSDSTASVEEENGVKVIRSGGGSRPGGEVIEVAKVLAQRLAPAPDPRLIEPSAYGLLPRIGADGARPADVYARPVTVPASAAHEPRIALVVGGVGLNEAATARAIHALPGPVTLAFAPYGKDLKGAAAQARDAGHEVILQLPMEPVDYPGTNPGPHMLLADTPDNRANLHWLMARFTGYAGVASFLGGKFLNAPAAAEPVLHDIAQRGLFYFEDGTAQESDGLTIARQIGLPAARADLILDAPVTGETMESRLTQLESIAREKGIAIGMASDLPDSLAKLASFAQMTSAHGIMLVPLSAAVADGARAASAAAEGRALQDR